jgi:N-methylhydantoinase A
VAVALLHSYAFPQHERLIGEYLKMRMPDLLISLSCDVLPERREYERTATTVVNAYIRPVMDRYLSALSERLEQLDVRSPLLIMQSAGGLTPAEDATNRPVFVLESGPAAGVLASRHAALELGIDNLITLDMGGTTAKASMIENGNVGYSAEYEVGATLSSGAGLMGGGGELIRAPSIDIAEVGAGGGSIAYLDSAGGLRVGPRSAGALPGPVCYGRGGREPTLTDANVVLGFIRPGALADGEVRIDLEAARQVIDECIATPLGLELAAAAEGIHRIANARTLRALRSVSSERGRDPRAFSLIAFGGSGPIHAAALGLELGVRQILIPPLPGLFSAVGLLCSGVEHHGVRSCLLSEERLCADALQSLRLEIETQMLAQFAAEGIAASEVELSCSVDVRFRGQTSEIRVSWPAGEMDDAVNTIQEGFADEHERLYGHRSDPDNPVEVRAVRLIGTAANAGMLGTDVTFGDVRSVGTTGSQRQVYFGQQNGYLSTPVIERVDLDSPQPGPLLIDEFDTTIVIPPHAHAHVDAHGNLIMTLGGK